MDELLTEAFRYNKWANLQLLDVCGKLSQEQLQLTAPGTYGTLAATWQHLVGGEQRYLRRFGHGGEGRLEDDPWPGIDVLKELAARTGDQLIAAAARTKPDETIEDKFHGRLHLGVVIVQALHHGDDHRTHICTILGQHEISYGDVDVWAYGLATGASER